MVEVPARVELAGGSDAPQVQLAIYCSMAVILDPALIRSARLRLALLDVRAETDLWFGPLIEHRSKQGLVLDASVLEWLRERLVDSGKLEEAAALMFEEHRHLGPSLRLEERLTHEALKGTSGDDLERLAAEALKAMKDKERRVLTRWADRAIDRLPQAARELSSTRAMKQAIAAWSDTDRQHSVSMGDSFADWALLLEQGSSPIELWLQLTDGVLRVSPEKRNGAQAIKVPDTEPIVILARWREGGKEKRAALLPDRHRVTTMKVGPELELELSDGTTYALAGSGTSKSKRRSVMVFGADAFFRELATPAILEAGADVERIPSEPAEIIRALHRAEVVVFDLRSNDPLLFYWLGVRHGLAPHSTIAVGTEEQARSLRLEVDRAGPLVVAFLHDRAELAIADELKRSLRERLGVVVDPSEAADRELEWASQRAQVDRVVVITRGERDSTWLRRELDAFAGSGRPAVALYLEVPQTTFNTAAMMVSDALARPERLADLLCSAPAGAFIAGEEDRPLRSKLTRRMRSALDQPRIDSPFHAASRATAPRMIRPDLEEMRRAMRRAQEELRKGDLLSASKALEIVLHHRDAPLERIVVLISTAMRDRSVEGLSNAGFRSMLYELDAIRGDTIECTLLSNLHERFFELTSDRTHLERAALLMMRAFFGLGGLFAGLETARLFDLLDSTRSPVSPHSPFFAMARRARLAVIGRARQTLDLDPQSSEASASLYEALMLTSHSDEAASVKRRAEAAGQTAGARWQETEDRLGPPTKVRLIPVFTDALRPHRPLITDPPRKRRLPVLAASIGREQIRPEFVEVMQQLSAGHFEWAVEIHPPKELRSDLLEPLVMFDLDVPDDPLLHALGVRHALVPEGTGVEAHIDQPIIPPGTQPISTWDSAAMIEALTGAMSASPVFEALPGLEAYALPQFPPGSAPPLEPSEKLLRDFGYDPKPVTGVQLAYLLDERASTATSQIDAATDRALADLVRKYVADIARRALRFERDAPEIQSALLEALHALGRGSESPEHLSTKIDEKLRARLDQIEAWRAPTRHLER